MTLAMATPKRRKMVAVENFIFDDVVG